MRIEFLSLWRAELGVPDRPCLDPVSRTRAFVSDESWSLIRVERGGYELNQVPYRAVLGAGDFHLGLPRLKTVLAGHPECPEPTCVAGLRFRVLEDTEPHDFWRLWGALSPSTCEAHGDLPPVVRAGLETGLTQVFEQALGEGERREPGWERAVEGLLQAALVRFGRAWMHGGAGTSSEPQSNSFQPAHRVPARWRSTEAHSKAPHHNNAQPDSKGMRISRERVRLVDGFMDRNLGRKISMHELCSVVNLSRQRLLEVYRAAKGQPPWETLQAKRLERARGLLADAARPVKEVAYSVGFKDPAYFTRVFSRRVGCAPAEFQRRAAGQA